MALQEPAQEARSPWFEKLDARPVGGVAHVEQQVAELGERLARDRGGAELTT